MAQYIQAMQLDIVTYKYIELFSAHATSSLI